MRGVSTSRQPTKKVYLSNCQTSHLIFVCYFTRRTFLHLRTWLFTLTTGCVSSTGDILVGCRCGCARGYGYERGCGRCWGCGYAHACGWGHGCAQARGCGRCGADCGNGPAGMPGGTSVGTSAGGRPSGTGTCHNAGSRAAARIGSHLDNSDGIKE